MKGYLENGGNQMDFYHSWLYQYILNSRWFLWMLVGAILGLNILGPLIYWRATSSKKILNKKNSEKNKA